MESCNNDNIKKLVITFFKDVNVSNAEQLYSKHGPYSPQASVACCYVKCLISLSIWRDSEIREAYHFTKSTYKMLGKMYTEHQRQTFSTPLDHILLKVLIAETQMLLGLMKIAIKRCMKHYLKAGLHFRASWRILNSVQSEVQELCERTGVNSDNMDTEFIQQTTYNVPTSPQDMLQDDTFLSEFDLLEDLASFFKGDWGIPTVKEINNLKTISQFGFGIFHLILSLIPPTILKIVNLMGFQGSRYIGITSLTFVTTDSHNFRGILANVVLLWYNLMIRPTYVTDAKYIKTGIHRAHELIDKLQQDSELQNSWLTLFFTARIHKLEEDFSRSLELYQKSCDLSLHLAEINMMARYEIGWCHLIQCNWEKAYLIFNQLMVEAQWSKSFYCYIAAVSSGAAGHIKKCLSLLTSVPSLVKKNMNMELNTYCVRKSEDLVRTACDEVVQYETYISTLEMLYLWRTLHLTQQSANDIISAVQNRPRGNDGINHGDISPSILAASYLLTGVAWLHLQQPDRAEQALKVVETIRCTTSRDSYLSVCALCELSVLYESQGRTELAQTVGKRAAREYRGYHLENKLFMMVKSRQM